MNTEEIDLFNRLKQGDEKAFEQIFQKFFRPLCYYANQVLKDQEAAQEIVQDLMAALWEKCNRIELNISLKAYLYRSVHNTCLNYIKHLKIRNKYQKHVKNRFHSSKSEFTTLIAESELEDQLSKALEKMPEKFSNVFCMNRFESLKYQEIADKLGISIKTVESYMGHALKFLRMSLKDFIKK